MKYILLILAVQIVAFKECNKNKDEIPSCVSKKIEEIKSMRKWNPPAEVNEYIYKGERTWLITSDCCDQYIVLYDGSCNYICAPSGGYTGKGDGKCADFYETARHVRLVWKDPR